MRNITSSVGTMCRFELCYNRIVFREKLLWVIDQLIERRALPKRRVVDLVLPLQGLVVSMARRFIWMTLSM